MQFSEEEKELWLEDWQQSGKSAWAYAKQNGLNTQTFVKWTKRRQEPKKALAGEEMTFVGIPVPMIPSPPPTQEILIEKGDVKIHIPLILGRSELRAVMEGLGCVL